MPPAHMVRFRRNAEKTGTFHRREASMPPLQCFCNVPKKPDKQQFDGLLI